MPECIAVSWPSEVVATVDGSSGVEWPAEDSTQTLSSSSAQLKVLTLSVYRKVRKEVSVRLGFDASSAQTGAFVCFRLP